MLSYKRLFLFVSCVAVALSSPLHSSDNPEEGEEEPSLFLSNDSAAADLATGGKNATVELNNETSTSNATSGAANGTLAAMEHDRSENATFRFTDIEPSMGAADNVSSAAAAPTEGHVSKDAVEESEDGVKNLSESELPRLFNATKEMDEEAKPLEGEEKALAEQDAKTTVGDEKMMTTEKAMAGLNENENGAVLPLTTPAAPMTLSAHPLEKESSVEEAAVEPSVLQMHPVLKRNRTIRFRASEMEEWHPYVDNMASFLEPYAKEAQERNVHCDFEKTLQEDQACRFDLVYLGPSCTKENNFGYSLGKPCVLLAPGNFANWVPSPYDNDTTDVPDEVQRLMRIFNANFMFVTCEGESESDRANIGPMAYLPPYQGFPSYFFPNKKDAVPNYVAPLMAIEFLNPTNGTLINVVCKAWAKNVPELPHPAILRFSLQVN